MLLPVGVVGQRQRQAEAGDEAEEQFASLLADDNAVRVSFFSASATTIASQRAELAIHSGTNTPPAFAGCGWATNAAKASAAIAPYTIRFIQTPESSVRTASAAFA